MLGERERKGNLRTDQRKRETVGAPKRGDPHGGRAARVITCLGSCPGQGEGPQGCGNVRDRVPEGANRKGISEEAQTKFQAWRAVCCESSLHGSGRGRRIWAVFW